MLKVTLLLSFVAAVFCQEAARYNRYVPPVAYRRNIRYDVDQGSRLNYVEDESPKPYAFSYSAPSDVGAGSSSRSETADGSGRVQGSYTVVNEEGHSRVVDYIADQDGFRATIRTDEPGTANQSPADVNLESTNTLTHSNIVHRPEAYRRPYYRAPASVPVPVEQPIEQPIEERPVVSSVVQRTPAVIAARRRPYYVARDPYRIRDPYHRY